MRLLSFLAALIGLTVAASAVAQAPAPALPAADPANVLVLDLSTGGRVSILLRPDKAPGTVERVKTLARRGFYNGLLFHRVIEGFMAQTGDPKGTGEGGSELPDLKAEFNDLPHVRGVVSMARAEGKDSANSQFFIMLSPTLRLDGKYTAFGRVISGMAYVDAIERGEPPANPSRVVKAFLLADEGKPITAAAPEPVPTPAAAAEAASAAAANASQQAADAAVAADQAADAARSGDEATAAERAGAAKTAAEGATEAAQDAADTAGQVEQAAPSEPQR